MITLKKKRIVAVLLFVLGITSAIAHPNGSSATIITYSDGYLKTSTRLFFPDFRTEYEKFATVKSKNYVLNGFNTSDDKDLNRYMDGHFLIWANNKKCNFQVTKRQIEKHDDSYIVLIEMKSRIKLSARDNLRIKNIFIVETLSAQKNFVNLFPVNSVLPSKGTLTFDKNNVEYEIIL